MNKRLLLLALCLLLVSLPAGISGCRVGIKSPSNAQFIIRVSGPAGAEFTGFCTHEVKYIIGSRTEETDISGNLTTSQDTFEFTIPGIEISCKITNKTPEKPITAVLLRDGVEVKRVDGLEYDFYLSWYPHIIIDTAAQAARGFRYEPSEHEGNVIEIAEFTAAERAKIAELVEKLSPEAKQQFESLFASLEATLKDPAYSVISSPWWKQTEPYRQLLQFCREQGEKVWPLIFQRLDEGDTFASYCIGSLLVDLSLDKHGDILERMRHESLHGRYTEDGLYILPYNFGGMRLAKEMLALL
jgi:hypothetical protein